VAIQSRLTETKPKVQH